MREITILFIDRAPLDVVLGAAGPTAHRDGLIFVITGVILFVVDDFLIVMGAVMFVCLGAAAYVSWGLRKERRAESKQPKS